jgi:hypothetical protein
MSTPQHLSESAPGLIGTSLAGSFTVVGFVANTIPILQIISLLAGIAVAVVTFVFYLRKIKKGE